MATLYYFDSDVLKEKEVTPENPKKGFQLKELYSMLNCDLVEIGHITETDIFVCDEEFRLKEGWEKRRNTMANMHTILLSGLNWDLAGNILICKDSEVK